MHGKFATEYYDVAPNLSKRACIAFGEGGWADFFFNMGIPTPGKDALYNETGPRRVCPDLR